MLWDRSERPVLFSHRESPLAKLGKLFELGRLADKAALTGG
jgi:hypothetical protein